MSVMLNSSICSAVGNFVAMPMCNRSSCSEERHNVAAIRWPTVIMPTNVLRVSSVSLCERKAGADIVDALIYSDCVRELSVSGELPTD